MNSFKQSVKKRPLVFFVIVNYAISWSLLYPCYQIILNAEEGFPLLALIGIPGGFGPSIAAILTVWITKDKGSVSILLKQFKSFKIHVKWYFFVITIPSSIYFLALQSATFFGYELGVIDYSEGISMAFIYLLLALPFGPLMEELGWRGYMLPELLKKNSIYKSSLILGAVWTFWHVASFTFPGAAIPSIFDVNALSITLYLLSITAQTFLFSYVYLKTNHSLILAILLHTSFNASSNIVLTFFPDAAENPELRLFVYTVNFILIFSFALLLLYKNHSPIPNS